MTPAAAIVTNLADMPVSQTPPGMVTLRSALSTAGVTSITFAPNLSGNINLYTTLPTLNGVTINNTTGNSIGVVGNWSFRLINTQPGSTNEIDKFEMDQGGGVEQGAGIYNAGSLTLNYCYMSLNDATDNNIPPTASGGAIFNNAGANLTLNNTTLFDNTATARGGGIFNYGDATIGSGSLIQSNSAHDGGGIYNGILGSLYINGSTVTSNDSSYHGAGIYNYADSFLEIIGSSIRSNITSGLGGGLYSDGTVTITGTDIEYNRADGKGGGFYLNSGSLTLTDSTLSNNISPFGNGGAWLTGSHYIDNGGNTITDQVVNDP